MDASHRLKLAAAFLALYLIWGSTYFAIRIGVESWPPFLMAGLRFVVAGSLVYAVLRWRGTPHPDRRQWASAALLGLLMPGIGNGFVTLAQREVSSGVAALMVATVPLFATLCSRLFGQLPRRLELLGVALGMMGIAVLKSGANLQASPGGALLLLTASAAWALGSAWNRHLPQAGGLMASATMMLCGGAGLLLGSVLLGERLDAVPPLSGWLALAYLTLFGSIVAYTAYLFLLKNVSAAAATSYAYVNPMIAVLLGVGLLGEHVGTHELAAMAIIVGAVVLIGWRR